jgi:hypothetical protein
MRRSSPDMLHADLACDLDSVPKASGTTRRSSLATWQAAGPRSATGRPAPAMGISPDPASGGIRIAVAESGRLAALPLPAFCTREIPIRPGCATHPRRSGGPGAQIGLIVPPDLACHTLEMNGRPLTQGRDICGRTGRCWLHRCAPGALRGGSHRQGAGATSPAPLDERPAGCRHRQNRGTAAATPRRRAGQRGADLRPARDPAPAADCARHAAARRGPAQDRLRAARAARSPSRPPGPAAFPYR